MPHLDVLENMKIKTIIILSILAPLILLAEVGPIQIAFVNTNTLRSIVGQEDLRELEFGKNIRDALRASRQEIQSLESLLIKADTMNELNKVTVKLEFLKSKMKYLSSIAAQNANRGSDQNRLEALIKENFKEEYAVILLARANPTTHFSDAIHQKIQYVDLTSSVAKLIEREINQKVY
jgi:hypothetical protein